MKRDLIATPQLIERASHLARKSKSRYNFIQSMISVKARYELTPPQTRVIEMALVYGPEKVGKYAGRCLKRFA